MDPTAWQELRAFLAQPQNVSRAVPGDTLIIHRWIFYGPPPDLFLEVSVSRITEDNRLVYGHSSYERAFDRAGIPTFRLRPCPGEWYSGCW
jgi:hypothetical protein